jgi:hypothetical protein
MSAVGGGLNRSTQHFPARNRAALAEQPNHGPAARIAAASHALAGNLERAANAMARVREVDPELRIADVRDRFPFRRPQDHARLVEGLRKAGVPE